MIGLMYPFIVFSQREKISRIICLIPPIMHWVLLEVTDYRALDYFGIKSLHLDQSYQGGIAMTVATMIIVTLSYYIFNWQTEKRELELVELSKKLEKRAREYSFLVRMVVHDIANSVFTGYLAADALENRYPDNDEVKRIKISSMQIQKIIGVVRTLHALNTSKTVFDMTKVDLNQSINEAVQSLRSQIEAKNIKTSTDVSQLCSYMVLADASLLTSSIIANLISNAVKFSQKNSTIELIGRQLNGKTQLDVIDHGIGIPKKLLDDLFSDGIATSRDGTEGEKGTGFGLPIVKASLELMNGHIFIMTRSIEEHPKDHGSTFTIELATAPFEPAITKASA